MKIIVKDKHKRQIILHDLPKRRLHHIPINVNHVMDTCAQNTLQNHRYMHFQRDRPLAAAPPRFT